MHAHESEAGSSALANTSNLNVQIGTYSPHWVSRAYAPSFRLFLLFSTQPNYCVLINRTKRIMTHFRGWCHRKDLKAHTKSNKTKHTQKRNKSNKQFNIYQSACFRSLGFVSLFFFQFCTINTWFGGAAATHCSQPKRARWCAWNESASAAGQTIRHTPNV